MFEDKKALITKELESELPIVREIKELLGCYQIVNSLRGLQDLQNTARENPTIVKQTTQKTGGEGVDRIEFSPVGGRYTYIKGYPRPYRGCPHNEIVQQIDFIKKVIKFTLEGIGRSYKGWKKILLPFHIFGIIKALESFIYSLYFFGDQERLKLIMYSQPIREMHRIFDNEIKAEKDEKERKKLVVQRDLVCLLMEYDNAYRFRAQDILSELDKEHLKKSFLGEMYRLCTLIVFRERYRVIGRKKFLWFTITKYRDVKKKMWFLKWLILGYLFINRGLAKKVKRMLLDMNIDEVKLNEDDKCYCRPRMDYTFGFLKKENRKLYDLQIKASELVNPTPGEVNLETIFKGRDKSKKKKTL